MTARIYTINKYKSTTPKPYVRVPRRHFGVLVILATLVLLPLTIASVLNGMSVTYAGAGDAAGPGTWAVDSACPQVGGTPQQLKGVSVTSSGTLYAVGSYFPDGSAVPQALIYYRSAGGSCAAYTSYSNPGGSRLWGVAEVSATEAWAVGSTAPNCANSPTGQCGTAALVLHWDGVTWSSVPVQAVGGVDNILYGVAVDPSNPANVWVVGAKNDIQGFQHQWRVLAEKYDGQQFVNDNPVASQGCTGDQFLQSAAVAQGSKLWAAGYCVGSNALVPEVIERVGSNNWQDTSVPYDQTKDNALYGITVDPTGDIRAVGGTRVLGGTWHPFYEHYLASTLSWNNYASDNNQTGVLYSVAGVNTDTMFPAITDVWAVGQVQAQQSFAVHNDNRAWTIIPNSYLPNNGNFGNLVAASAHQVYSNGHGGFSASELWAVGDYSDQAGSHALIVHYTPTTPQLPGAPNYTTSYYVQVATPDTYRQFGCSDRAAGKSGIVVLDFGAPRNLSAATPGATPTFGTQIFARPVIFTDMSQIESIAQAYASGYAMATCVPSTPQPQQFIVIAVGTNNDVEDHIRVSINSAHGAAWGSMINHLQATATVGGNQNIVTFAAAMDIEQGSDQAGPGSPTPTQVWSGPTPVVNWINGYQGVSSARIYNYGSCDGCDPSNDNSSGQLAWGWTEQDVYNVSWGLSNQVRALPEIYHYGEFVFLPPGPCPCDRYALQAEQWRRVSAHFNSGGSSIAFSGSLSESMDTTNTPKDAWLQLWQALNFDPTGQTARPLSWSSDITRPFGQ